MQSKTCILALLFFLIISVVSSIHAQIPDTICNLLPLPVAAADLCKSILQNNKSSTILDLGLNSIQNSISLTTNFTSLVNRFLNPDFKFPGSTVRALQNCQSLATLNQQFLSITTKSLLQIPVHSLTSEAESLQTLLSAAITNYETCLQGLKEVNSPLNILNALLGPLSNGRAAYSVSLAILVRVSGAPSAAIRNPPRSLQVVQSGVKVRQIVYVNPNGKSNFKKISDAVNAAPENTTADDGYYVISIANGIYPEYIRVPIYKKYIMMIGAGINKTVITGSRSVVDGWTTYDCATLAVDGEGFVAQGITIQNTAGPVKQQAVAVRNSADLSVFFNCSFEGYQDTLFTQAMRQFYKKCDIYGTVDFIFGNAAVVLQSCNIYPRRPARGQFNVIVAQGRTDKNQNTGTCLQDCYIKAAPDLSLGNETTQTYLGRPWKAYSRTVYMQSFLDGFVNPAGWVEWSGNAWLSTLYFAEYKNKGAGSGTSKRVKWPGYHPMISAGDASNFTVFKFIHGNEWLYRTGVPVHIGLY